MRSEDLAQEKQLYNACASLAVALGQADMLQQRTELEVSPSVSS